MILPFLYSVLAVIVFRVLFGLGHYFLTVRVYQADRYKDVLADKKANWLFHVINEVGIALLTVGAYASWVMGNESTVVMGLLFGVTVGLLVYVPLSVTDLLEIKSFDFRLFALRVVPGVLSVALSGIILSLMYTYL